MLNVVTAEIISVIFLLVSLVSQFSFHDGTKSAKRMRICTAVMLCQLCADAACYLLKASDIPVAVQWVVVSATYMLGGIVAAWFIWYCHAFVAERTELKLRSTMIPMALITVIELIIAVELATGRLIVVEAGCIREAGRVPMIAVVLYGMVLLYTPWLAVSRRRAIGMRAVWMLSLGCVMPLFGLLSGLIFGQDYSVVFEAMSLTIVADLLQKDSARRQLARANEELSEREAGLRRRLDIISAMNSVYMASYYVDLAADSSVTLSVTDYVQERMDERLGFTERLHALIDRAVAPEFRDTIHHFADFSDIDERLRDTSVIQCRFKSVRGIWGLAYLIAADRDAHGKLRHLFVAVRSIQNEHDAEERQLRRMTELTGIVTNAGLGIWYIYLKDGCAPRMRANEKMLELLGVSGDVSEEECYEDWYGRIDPGAIESVQRSVTEMISGSFSENTYKWNHPVKGMIYVRCGGTAARLEDGTEVLSGYHADVTDIVLADKRKQAELAEAKQAAEKANRAKSTFLFNMSHDIRTPLNAIIGYTDLIIGCGADKARTLDYAAKIRNAGGFLTSLVNNVLEMARIESGKATLNEEPCAAWEISEDLNTVFAEQMRKKHLEFSCEADMAKRYVYADRLKLREIYLNLISNAYKYTPEGGRVCASFRELPCEQPDHVVIEARVSDTGIGMSADFLPRLFDEFSRSRSSTESGIQGTGLGMAIVKRYIELMGGSIDVESEVGVGTTFTVTIMHRIAHVGDVAAEDPSDIDLTVLDGRRVLLAEDNDLNAEITEEILGEAGVRMERARDGVECVDMLSRAEDGYYDLILMDIQMPNLNGYEATRKIRALRDERKAGIPILAMTANAFEEDRRNALAAGMNGHLAKPVDVSALMGALARVLSRD